MIGKLERLPLRSVWPHEAYAFTTWLTDNIEVLGDVLGLELTNAEREQAAGSFSVDVVAEDVGGNPVIIENQYGKSDHDHLGKLLTYLTAFEAKIAVWIVEEPRPEHVRAVAWLNEASSGAFFLVKVEAIRIGDSPPAPLLTVIVEPSVEAREVGERKRELVERHHHRKRFWTKLLERARHRTKLHANISPGIDSWISAGAGTAGVSFNYVVRQRDTRVELYIDRGDTALNEEFLDRLLEQQDEIEASFGAGLEWQRLEGRRACRIAYPLEEGGIRDEEKWVEIIDSTVEAMARFEMALRPHLVQLR